MKAARIDTAGTITVQDLRTMFPETLFPDGGPNAQFYVEQGVYPVADAPAYDPATQQLVPTAPYLLNGVVYLSAVQPLPAGGNVSVPI